MSYCRFAWGGSDVYVYAGDDGLECCGCRLSGDEGFTAQTPEAMITHLAEHKKANHFVPPGAIRSLWEDIEGPNEPVRPEPESLTKARLFMEEAKLKIALESAWAAERARIKEIP